MRAFACSSLFLSTILAVGMLSGCADEPVRTRDSRTADAGTGVPPISTPQRNPDGTCQRIEVGATPGQQPRVMIVLDKSESMERDGLWGPAVAAVTQITQSLDDRVAFGLATFPDYVPSTILPLTPEEQIAACGTGSVKVDMDVGTAAAIATELGATNVDGNTPTAGTLDAVRLAIIGADFPSQVVVLVTDGAPNCGAAPPAVCECTAPTVVCQPQHCLDRLAIDAVSNIAAAGAPVYVVGFRTSAFSEVLDAMAAAGRTGRDTHILADNGADLRDALTGIAGSVLPCTYELEGVPSDLAYVKVLLDEVPLDHESVSPTRGWRLVGDKTVELVGDACSTVQDATRPHEIAITVECDPVTLF